VALRAGGNRAGHEQALEGSGSCMISAIVRPTTSEAASEVIVSAARLNVRIRPSMSEVVRPLVRLSMTCWLNACRSSSCDEALASCAPVRRRPSAR
jgi:hypothetical protein